jgi:hypothetical protein
VTAPFSGAVPVVALVGGPGVRGKREGRREEGREREGGRGR